MMAGMNAGRLNQFHICFSQFLWPASDRKVSEEGGDDCGKHETDGWNPISSNYFQRSQTDYETLLF